MDASLLSSSSSTAFFAFTPSLFNLESEDTLKSYFSIPSAIASAPAPDMDAYSSFLSMSTQQLLGSDHKPLATPLPLWPYQGGSITECLNLLMFGNANTNAAEAWPGRPEDESAALVLALDGRPEDAGVEAPQNLPFTLQPPPPAQQQQPDWANFFTHSPVALSAVSSPSASPRPPHRTPVVAPPPKRSDSGSSSTTSNGGAVRRRGVRSSDEGLDPIALAKKEKRRAINRSSAKTFRERRKLRKMMEGQETMAEKDKLINEAHDLLKNLERENESLAELVERYRVGQGESL